MRVSFALALALLSLFGGGGGNFSEDGFGQNQASWWSRLPIFPLSCSSLERVTSVDECFSRSCGGARALSLDGVSVGFGVACDDNCGMGKAGGASGLDQLFNPGGLFLDPEPAWFGRRLGSHPICRSELGCFGAQAVAAVLVMAVGRRLVPLLGQVLGDVLLRSGAFGREWLGMRRLRRHACLAKVAAAGNVFQPSLGWAEAGVFGPRPGLNLARVGFDGLCAKHSSGLLTMEGLTVPTPPE